MDLDVILVSWNTRNHLRRCLLSLRAAAAVLSPDRLDVIVIDNASVDGSAAMVGAEFPEARLVANPTNLNYASASNQALELTQGEIVLLLNPDTEVSSAAVGQLLSLLKERPRAAAVAPALVHPDGRVQRSVRGFPTPLALLGELTGLARLVPRSPLGAYWPRDLPEDQPAPVEQPMASCLLCRMAALKELGGFDERFPLFFNDVDLCYRLKQASWEIWYEPRARVLHHGGASTRQVRPQAIWTSHQALRRFYRKHYRARLGPVLAGLIDALVVTAGVIRCGLAWLNQPRRAGKR